jgi:hypothetical protein
VVPVDTGAGSSPRRRSDLLVLIDTIAMIGSPASRRRRLGGGAGAPLAAASAVSAAVAAIAASVTMAGPPQRRISTVDRAVINRFTMPCPG